MHLYPGPKYDSIFPHLAGDSTITNVFDSLIGLCILSIFKEIYLSLFCKNLLVL